ncbi:chromatin modification-related protein EAF1 [Scaptodrosophila lebanonensis]|uniref:Chromatin modification-related protein EAF1 n=1 Tax=Drosophila lebanonensis TaxID=7225 RepID=A0A6J2TUM1_DROLE|nr:chromatin modification-related protein EAF1 [Scaptodrosophila lebanonensis]
MHLAMSLPVLSLLLVLSAAGGCDAAALTTTSGGLTVIDAAATTTTTTTTLLGQRQSQQQQQQQQQGSSVALSLHAVYEATQAQSQSQQQQPLRKRHRKRNSNWYDYRNYNENTTALEWMNPCGGFYMPSPTGGGFGDGRANRRRMNPKQIFNLLKRAAGSEYRSLRGNQEGIDISDMQMWSLHNYNYKFLPKLKLNSTIALKRWYRNMQTYVASFAYLRRMQINWDRQHLKRESRAARELKLLLLSSRSMLCELETAVNHTYPAPSAAQRRQLPQISRNDMNKRLKLRSKRRPATSSPTSMSTSSSASASAAFEADSIDLQFVKHHYYEFLRTMWQLLRQNGKRNRRRLAREHQGQRQRDRQQQQQQKQRQQQQQQQLLAQRQKRLQLDAAINRKEFNEVAKPTAELAAGRRGKRQQPASACPAYALSYGHDHVLRVLSDYVSLKLN